MIFYDIFDILCSSGTAARSGLRVVYSTMLAAGLPMSSYRGKDGQSDLEAAHVLNPAYLCEDAWDNLGMHCFQLKLALSCGQWTASGAFNPSQLLENAATGALTKLIQRVGLCLKNVEVCWSHWKAVRLFMNYYYLEHPCISYICLV